MGYSTVKPVTGVAPRLAPPEAEGLTLGVTSMLASVNAAGPPATAHPPTNKRTQHPAARARHEALALCMRGWYPRHFRIRSDVLKPLPELRKGPELVASADEGAGARPTRDES